MTSTQRDQRKPIAKKAESQGRRYRALKKIALEKKRTTQKA